MWRRPLGTLASIVTTGNRDFAECKILYRVLKIGHSAKTFFAECYTRQRIALGKKGHSAKDFFADCQTLGKISTLGIGCPRNGVLCRVPAVRHSAKKVFTTGNRDFAECKIICRVSKIGHSAKTFFAECCTQRVLCRVPGTRQQNALGKGLLCRVPDSRHNLYTRHRLPAKRRSVTAFFAECGRTS